MNNQITPYDPVRSAHFINLALAAEAQSAWETSGQAGEQLENPFAIPLDCYDKIFESAGLSGEAVKADVEGPLQEQYEFVGSIRFGHQLIADYEDQDEDLSLNDVQDLDAIVKLMTGYSRRWSESISNIVRYNRSDLLMGFALRSKADGHGVIVLRGTMTTEEWLNNVNYRLTPFILGYPEYGNVHQGFRDIYKGIRGRYRELAAQFDVEQELYLVGHSLGAALSTLGGLDLVYREPARSSKIQAYLFAPPRIGDPTFAQVYNEQVGTSYRIVNVCDIVPYVPFEELNLIADVLSYPYTDTKGEIAYVHQAGNPITNHVASYHLATRDQIPGPMDATKPQRL